MGLKQSLNLWRNLRLLKWLNFSRSVVSNFASIGSCIENYVKIMWKTALTLINLLFDSLTQKRNKYYMKRSVCRKIPLSCFYLQLEFDNYEHNCQSQVLEILQRKTLYRVSFDQDFLEIYWLIGSKVVSKIAPHQTKKYFFQWRSLCHRGFSTLIATNSRVTLTKEKKTQKPRKCPKKEIDNCHSARRL